MNFTLEHSDQASAARAGSLQTSHGIIRTPVFMPVGTAGTVKAVHQRELTDDIGAQIILGNTYHLYLRPGLDILQKAGGLHGFNGWTRPILTDSGGYQVFSLSETRKIREEGVTFRSHIDGSRHLFTPENTIDTQRIIGADIIMALDECTPLPLPLRLCSAVDAPDAPVAGTLRRAFQRNDILVRARAAAVPDCTGQHL